MGTPIAFTTSFPNGIAATSAVGTPTVSTILPNGIASTSAVGAPVGITTQVADGIASTAVLGAPSGTTSQVADGIASTATVGAPTHGHGITIFSVPSSAAFGIPVVAGPITLVGLASSAAFGTFSVLNFGALRRLFGARGELSGGTRVGFAGAVLVANECQDAFDDGMVGTNWSSLNAGGGTTTEFSAPSAGLELWAEGAGSVAGVRSVDARAALDVAATFTVREVSALRLPVLAGALRLEVGSDTFSLELWYLDATTTLVRAVVGGRETVRLSAGTGMDLRLVRHGDVFAYVNGTRVARASWVTGNATHALLVSGATGGSVRTLVTNYVWSPVMTFGDAPANYTRVGDGTVVASAPSAMLPGPVDVTVVGCLGTETIVDGFSYDADGLVVAETGGGIRLRMR